jgi:flavin-dependent dehydrogenase
VRPEIADVAIVGGGPAGAAAARLLSQWGRRVVLLTRGPNPRPLGESLPPSCTKLFDQLGIRGSVDGAGFVRATGNTVQWAGKPRAVEMFDPDVQGYQVSRDAFDALLLAASEASGATIIRDVNVTSVDRLETSHWGVGYHGLAGGSLVDARWVLDCSGRSGVVARREWRRPSATARTIALVGVWERPGWRIEEMTHTLVESYAGGWGWSVPVSENRRYVTVMLDPAITEIPTRSRLAEAFGEELSRTSMLAEILVGATPVGDPWGCDASAYSADRFADDGVVLVGDAASFVDPLSSFGIKKALASAWLAAVAVNTALADATMTTPALELFARRERTMFDHLQRQSATLARDAAGAHVSTYWENRSDVDAVLEDSELDVTRLRGDERVLGAFNELRHRDSVALRPSESLGFVNRAVVRGNRVRLERHLVNASFVTPVRYCRGVDLVLVTELSGRHSQVADLFDAYNRVAPPAPLPDFLGALSTLIGYGALTFA